MRIIIDPRAKISYASFYIYGMYKLFGRSSVTFSGRYFRDLKQTDGYDDFDHYFAFIVKNNGIRRFVIDYRDKSSINLNALRWADVYGKVNYNKSSFEPSVGLSLMQKIIPIGPNFGIKIYDDLQTLTLLTINYYKCWKNLPVSFRSFIAGYNWQRKRPKYKHYIVSALQGEYVFFISTLYQTSHSLETNAFRAAFIGACKASGANFEGGLLARKEDPEYYKYSDIITSLYVKPGEYLKKIKKSILVFNTPALWGCHGWKLGEYFAMGKAIVSTKLNNEMPSPLVHGENIHFVESEAEIYDAVVRIINDPVYRKRLEDGSRDYYSEFLAPESVIKRLINY
jgi:glycosyltransferase involved in cell wall biosynthesis